MGWLIRNGRIISFWHDNWLKLGPLRGLISGPLLPHEFNLKVGDMCDEYGCWNLGNLSFQLPPHISNQILASPCPLISNLEDCMFWKPTNNGQFNFALAYRVACELESPNLTTGAWKWIWKINTIPTVASFIWLSCHGRLPTKSFLFKCKIILNDFCPICNSESKTILHVLRDCSFVKGVWYNIGSSLPPNFFTTNTLKNWMHQWATSSLET